MAHGHERSDRRNLHLHRVAFAKLRKQPQLKHECLRLVDSWLQSRELEPARRWLRQWREMLADWPLERMAQAVLDPEEGQTLRQCSPLAPVLTPHERWEALAAVDAAVGRDHPPSSR